VAQTLTAETWRSKRRRPKVVALRSLEGAKVILRPMSAFRRTEIDKASGEDNRKLFAELIAETVVAGEIEGDEITAVGSPIWKAEDFFGEDFPAEVLIELTELIGSYFVPDDAGKNSIPATVSHTV
jgi:hypothetical protein